MITSARFVTRQAVRRGSRRTAAVAMSRRGAAPLASTMMLRNSLFRPAVAVMEYTTERVLQLRSGKSAEEQPKVLYNPKNETENCGVGLIASLKSTPSKHVVDVADEMLVRMSHRGGCGCDPASGDGAGKLTNIF